MPKPQTPDEAQRLAEELGSLGAALARSREAARQSDRRLSLALQAFESMVWELSFTDRRLFVTGAVAAIYNPSPTYQDLADDLLFACHPLDRPRVEALWKAHLEEGRPFRTDYRISRSDDREVWVEAAAEMLRDEAGAPERVIGVVKDITGKKLDQIAMAHARQAAEAANRAKSEFLANMSHEIRTPLNGVLGVTGALARTGLEPQQQEMVKLIERSAQTLERLLGDVLDIARIESGRLEIKREPFDLGELLREVAALFEPQAHAKGVAFLVDVEDACEGRFVGDEVRLRQILVHLLSNAVKFTSEGAVTLSVETTASETSRTAVRFRVSDTGIGFDPATATRLFHRFQQGDGSTTRRYGGAGLGLAISKALALRMGGDLEAGSEPERGAVFTLNLELEHAPAADSDRAVDGASGGPSAQGALVGPNGQPPRILLAEDHPTNRKVAEMILGAAGARLVHVENGAEAVSAAETQDFDLILMDMQMPVMDGLAAIRAIRARERAQGLARTPILTLTANAMAEHARASHEAGADGHVTKPVSAKTLLEDVARAISGQVVHKTAAA